MPTLEKNNAAIEGLIAKANEKTGENATDLTTAVDGLLAGYGQGGEEYDGTVVIEGEANSIEFYDGSVVID